MITYYLPDITGTNENYLRVNVPRTYWKEGVKLFFPNSPIFLDSLRIATTDGLSTLLVRGVDYVVGDDDIDELAMERATGEDPSFDKFLLKSITMKSAKGLKQKLAFTYQEFYLTDPSRLVDDGRPFEVTPELIQSLVIGQADIRQQLARVTSPITAPLETPRLLSLDLNKERLTNRITDETAVVNTVAGTRVIRPVQGAFFADSVVIRHNGVPLSKDTDYVPIDMSALTKQTANTSGIYRYILLLKPITGEIEWDYHAVGGDVQPDDLQKTFDTVVAIKTFLDESIFLTPETVVDSVAVRAAYARLNTLEEQVRSILNGSPTYNDATGGLSVVRPVAATNSDLHWYTIASLYKVQGSSDLILADQFKGRVFFPTAKVSLAFTVDVSLEQTRNPVSFQTDSLVFDPTYTLFGDVSVAAPVYPLVRAIWDQNGQSYSGILLQVGIPLTALNDTMVVEDLSTTESGWLLDLSNRKLSGSPAPSSSAPKDNNITMPDNTTTWSSGSATAKNKTFLPSFNDGYLVWTGTTVDVNDLDTNASTESLFAVKLPDYVPLHTLKTVVVTLTAPDGTGVYDVVIPLSAGASGSRTGRVCFAVNDVSVVPVAMVITLRRDNANHIKLNINTPGGTGVPDQIRYVRVRS